MQLTPPPFVNPDPADMLARLFFILAKLGKQVERSASEEAPRSTLVTCTSAHVHRYICTGTCMNKDNQMEASPTVS